MMPASSSMSMIFAEWLYPQPSLRWKWLVEARFVLMMHSTAFLKSFAFS